MLVDFLGDLSEADKCFEVILEDNVLFYHFMLSMEYKHKSEASTIHEAQNIKSTVLNGSRIRVLTLGKDDEIHKAVPNVNCRCQVIHQAVVCRVPVAVFAVATTSIEFVLILLIPPFLCMTYLDATNFIKKKYLGWLFTEESDYGVFDQKLETHLLYYRSSIQLC